MGDMDLEVLSLLNRVKVVQKELFGSEVRDLEGGGGGKVDKFLDTYDTINNKIDLLHELGAQLQLTNKPGLGATTNFVDPKERIEAQSKFRTTLNEVQEDFNTMETLHRMEKRKKRSRISDEEIQQRENMLLHIERNLQMFKDSQKMNFLNKVAGANPELAKYMQGRRLVNMEDSELFKAPESQQMVDENGEPIQPTGAKCKINLFCFIYIYFLLYYYFILFLDSSTGVMLPTRGPDMTDQHRQQLLLIREKDAKIVSQYYLLLFKLYSLIPFFSLSFSILGYGNWTYW